MFLSSYSNFTCSLEKNTGGEQKEYTRSSDDRIIWAKEGAQLFGDYMAGEGKYNCLQ